MRFLLVGTGSIGAKHARNIAQLEPEAEIVLVRHGKGKNPYVDDLQASLPHWKEAFSLQEALARKPDAALVCNPTSLHVATALDILPGCATILLEKPVSHSHEGVDRLAALAKKRKADILVGYTLRWHPVVRRIRRMLEKGALGKIYSAHIFCSSYLPAWREGQDYRTMYSAKQSLGGGVILDLSHEIDYCLWLFGPAKSVMAMGGRLSDLEIDTEDNADLLIRHAGGTISHIHLDYTTKDQQRGIVIKGEKGTLRGDLIEGTVMGTIGGEPVREKLPESTHLLDEMRHFIAMAKGKEKSAIPLSEGIAVLDVCLAAKEQL